MKTEIRYCADIGMFVTDRPRKETCHWRTEACKGCYNEKLEKLYPAMLEKDKRNETYWSFLNGAEMSKVLGNKKKQTKRFRFQTRGETFSSLTDVFKIREILETNPDVLFWIPTRAWRNPLLKMLIEQNIFSLSNARTLASTDIYTKMSEWQDLKNTNWSTMFFGDDSKTTTPTGEKHFLCPKTHKKLTGHCAICKAGCFRKDKIVNVHLKQH